MSNEKDSLLFKVREQIKVMDQQAKEASTFSTAWWDQEAYDLLKRIEKELMNTRNI